MKVALVLFLCSYVADSCLEPYYFPTHFDDFGQSAKSTHKCETIPKGLHLVTQWVTYVTHGLRT